VACVKATALFFLFFKLITNNQTSERINRIITINFRTIAPAMWKNRNFCFLNDNFFARVFRLQLVHLCAKKKKRGEGEGNKWANLFGCFASGLVRLRLCAKTSFLISPILLCLYISIACLRHQLHSNNNCRRNSTAKCSLIISKWNCWCHPFT
jgi:hypothetical protein